MTESFKDHIMSQPKAPADPALVKPGTVEKTALLPFTLSELVIMRDAIALLEPLDDDEAQNEIANDLCADLEQRLTDEIEQLR